MIYSRNLFSLAFCLFWVTLFYTSCDENNVIPMCNSDVFFADTCVNYSINELDVIQQGNQFVVTNNTNFRIEFEYMGEAEMALEVIQNYQFNEYCIIGKDTSFSYFLTDDQIPEGGFDGEDCLTHELCNLQVKLISTGKYTVVEPTSIGDEWMYSTESQDTTYQILQTLQFYQPTYRCYVGRPRTKMHYLRK